MRYITKSPNSEGQRLTMPLKVRLTAQAWFGQNDEWQSYASYFLRLATKESQQKLSRWSVSGMAMANDSTKKQCRVWCFVVLFTFLVHFWLAIAKVISSFALRACVQLWNISPRPLQTFIQLEQCASYRGSRWILSRRQHAPTKQCALNNDVRLITWFYGTLLLRISMFQTCHVISLYMKIDWMTLLPVVAHAKIWQPLRNLTFTTQHNKEVDY